MNGYWMIGSKLNQQAPYQDVMSLSRLDTDLDRTFVYKYSRFDSNYSDNQILCYQPTQDGGLIFGGLTRQGIGNPEPHLRGFWLLKLDEFGCLVPGCQSVGVEEIILNLQDRLHVWPNPVVSGQQLSILFDPPSQLQPNGPLRLIIQDKLGRTIHEEHAFGTSIELNIDLSQGLYWVHLADNDRWLAGSKVMVE
jgi:hypothetical protein